MVREIGELTGALVSAVARGDAAAIGATYGDDGRLITSSAQLFDGRGGIEAYWRTGITLGLVGIELRTLHLDATRTPRWRSVGTHSPFGETRETQSRSAGPFSPSIAGGATARAVARSDVFNVGNRPAERSSA